MYEIINSRGGDLAKKSSDYLEVCSPTYVKTALLWEKLTSAGS